MPEPSTKVLIVEDERLIAADMESYLERIGYEVVGCVAAGEKAVDIVDSARPDIVLMDIILKGDMDGIQAAQRIREEYDIPVVFVVAHADEKTVQRAKRTEPYGYILKPYKEEELRVVLELALYKHGMERKLRQNEERFRTLYENTTIGLYRTTPDGTILMANPALVSMLGFDSLEDLASRNLEEDGFEPRYPRSRFKSNIDKQGSILGLESAWKKSDGTVLYVRESARAVKDEQGQILYYEGTVENITEKKKTEMALELSHAEWEKTFNAISDWVSLIGLDRRILKTNTSGESFTGIANASIVGQDCCYLLHGRKDPLDACPVETMIKSGKRESIDLPSLDGGRWFEITADPLFDRGGELNRAVHIVRDITEKKKTEHALEESEQKFRLLYERTPMGYQSLDEEGCFLEVSPAWLHMLEYTREEVIGASFAALLTPNSRKHFRRNFNRFKKEGTVSGVKFRMQRKVGEPIDVEFYGRVGYDDQGHFLQTHCILHDITEQTKAERELQKSREELANLAAHLQSIRENERAKVAREIHDELGQVLTALKIDLSWTCSHIHRSDKPVSEKIQAMIKLIDSVIRTVKKISSDLRPGILDDLGLSAAIEWQTEEFRKRTGLECTLEIHPEEIVLAEHISIAVFRIFQEAMTNIARHAGASAVRIEMRKEDGRLTLEIEDDGRGITKRQAEGSKSFGLIGIRERTLFLGGKVRIEGRRNRGTSLNLQIPVRRERESRMGHIA